MVDYTSATRPGPKGRPLDYATDYAHRTTVVRSDNGNGVMAAAVLFTILAAAGFVLWTADEESMNPTATPAATINMQVAPAADAIPARPVPAPVVPAEIQPAAPADTAPAATGN